MSFNKTIENGYIIAIGTIFRDNYGNITEEEYNQILNIIRNEPVAPEGYIYKLKEDLTWELHEIPLVPPEEVTDEEIANSIKEIL